MTKIIIPYVSDEEIYEHVAITHGLGRKPSLMAKTPIECHEVHNGISDWGNHIHGVSFTRASTPERDFMEFAWTGEASALWNYHPPLI